MSPEEKYNFVTRILTVTENDAAQFGQMNVKQMVCHCADQFRMLFGEVEGLEKQDVDVIKLQSLALANKTVPTVKGLDQVKGEGTKPTTLQDDKQLLISYVDKFTATGENYVFSFHPYFGQLSKEKWERLVIHHLDHHLKQFGR